MLMKKATSLLVAGAMLFGSVAGGCTSDNIDSGNENVEPGGALGYGELLPGPDYTVQSDPTYNYVVATQGGPQTEEDWATLDTLEGALDEAARETWTQLPGWVASEFPDLTESERGHLISDFQDAVAIAQEMRDNPNSANCVEMYIEDPTTHEASWAPVCESDFGPKFDNRIGKIVRWVATHAEAGRQAVGRAANYVGNIATRAAGQAKVVAGQVLQQARTVAGEALRQAKAAGAYAAQRAGQVAGWARQQAGKGWAIVKAKWADWVGAGVVGAVVLDFYEAAKKRLFGGHTETSTTTNAALMFKDGDGRANLDSLFDM